MTTQGVVYAWRQKAIQEGYETGFQIGYDSGFRIGYERAFRIGLVCALVATYEARFGAMSEHVRAIVEGTRSESVLRTWHKLAASCGAEEINNAIRARRAA
jgi:flagellar biosynthesis/type III secretory pathway protein FliH